MLAGSDIQYLKKDRADIALVVNHNMALIFLPAADIPGAVADGHVDLGITGRDQMAECEAQLPPGETMGAEEVLDMGFGSCKLQVQVPKDGPYTSAKDLVGKRIRTTFVGLTSKYFAQLEALEVNGTPENHARTGKPLQTSIRAMTGSVESSCALGMADGVVDLVGRLSLPSTESVS